MNTDNRRSVLAAGYATLDVIVHNGQISHQAGGTAANVAANLAYFGWTSSLAARLGRDSAGRRILDGLRRAAVLTDLVERDASTQTPVVLYQIEPPAHWFSFHCPDCHRRLPRHRPISNDHLERRLLDPERIAPDVFFFDRASASALRLAEHFRERGATIVFEPSAPGRPERTRRAAGLAHILKCSQQRRSRLPSDLFVARPNQLQIETRGADGLGYRVAADRWKMLRAPSVAVNDTGGAGDWLTAAFLSKLPRTQPSGLALKNIRNALEHAQEIASLNCQLLGARTLASLPLASVLAAAGSNGNGNGHRELQPLAVRRISRSRATGVCRTCLVAPDSVT